MAVMPVVLVVPLIAAASAVKSLVLEITADRNTEAVPDSVS